MTISNFAYDDITFLTDRGRFVSSSVRIYIYEMKTIAKEKEIRRGVAPTSLRPVNASIRPASVCIYARVTAGERRETPM